MIAEEKPTVIGRQAVLPHRISPATSRAMPNATPTRGIPLIRFASAAARGDGQAPPVGRAHAVPGSVGKVRLQAAKIATGTVYHAAVQPKVARKWRSGGTSTGIGGGRKSVDGAAGGTGRPGAPQRGSSGRIGRAVARTVRGVVGGTTRGAAGGIAGGTVGGTGGGPARGTAGGGIGGGIGGPLGGTAGETGAGIGTRPVNRSRGDRCRCRGTQSPSSGSSPPWRGSACLTVTLHTVLPTCATRRCEFLSHTSCGKTFPCSEHIDPRIPKGIHRLCTASHTPLERLVHRLSQASSTGMFVGSPPRP